MHPLIRKIVNVLAAGQRFLIYNYILLQILMLISLYVQQYSGEMYDSLIVLIIKEILDAMCFKEIYKTIKGCITIFQDMSKTNIEISLLTRFRIIIVALVITIGGSLLPIMGILFSVFMNLYYVFIEPVLLLTNVLTMIFVKPLHLIIGFCYALIYASAAVLIAKFNITEQRFKKSKQDLECVHLFYRTHLQLTAIVKQLDDVAAPFLLVGIIFNIYFTARMYRDFCRNVAKDYFLEYAYEFNYFEQYLVLWLVHIGVITAIISTFSSINHKVNNFIE